MYSERVVLCCVVLCLCVLIIGAIGVVVGLVVACMFGSH